MTPPRQLTVRLGDDLNWWPEPTPHRGILDPRQVAHLVVELPQFDPYGLTAEQFTAAFQVYSVESEVTEGELRLRAVDESIHQAGEQLFALPLLDEEGTGPYADFLTALSATRIRLLNATHDYAHACTELEMSEELDLLDSDRYFNEDAIHAFDEINEILTWSPAEWDSSDT